MALQDGNAKVAVKLKPMKYAVDILVKNILILSFVVSDAIKFIEFLYTVFSVGFLEWIIKHSLKYQLTRQQVTLVLHYVAFMPDCNY